uniref:Protein FAM50 homolog n=1 Tax=Panagrolaimus davidi TaxID=227884 RepID=A0A914QVG5_9BILA
MSAADFGRLIHLAKKREREKEDSERQKAKLEEECKRVQQEISEKFTSNAEEKNDEVVVDTQGGLVTLGEMKQKNLKSFHAGDDVITGKKGEADRKEKEMKKEREKKVIQKRILSFNPDEDDEDEDPIVIPKKRLGMDPSVDTSFLPDRERELETIKKKEELVKEWRELQDKEKNDQINVAYCYWDGSAHRKDMKVKKGDTITQFITHALEVLRKEFSELKVVSSDNIMFIKEDLIIPHFYTFLDFVATRMMGKTGPLWIFDAIGEIRLRQDAALDAGEPHPVKLVLRSWYEKNKHIYPASRWEAFVPKKEYRRTCDDLTDI